jgi:hypothetical protein
MAKKYKAPTYTEPVADIVAHAEADALVAGIETATEAPKVEAPKSDPDWCEYAPNQPFVNDIQKRIDRKADKIQYHDKDSAEVTMPNGSIARVQLADGKIIRCAVKKKQ